MHPTPLFQGLLKEVVDLIRTLFSRVSGSENLSRIREPLVRSGGFLRGQGSINGFFLAER
jgi:hypothetical protein